MQLLRHTAAHKRMNLLASIGVCFLFLLCPAAVYMRPCRDALQAYKHDREQEAERLKENLETKTKQKREQKNINYINVIEPKEILQFN